MPVIILDLSDSEPLFVLALIRDGHLQLPADVKRSRVHTFSAVDLGVLLIC